MKTVGDIERYLRQDHGNMIELWRQDDLFCCEVAGAIGKSKTLSGAIENCMIEMRTVSMARETLASTEASPVGYVRWLCGSCRTVNSPYAACKCGARQASNRQVVP